MTSTNYTNYSLIISHNYRIQCLLGKLGYRLEQNFNFKHGCVLKITAETKKNVKLEMLYPGLNESNDSKSYYRKFELKEAPIILNSYKNQVFYIIRYAKDESNIRNCANSIDKDLENDMLSNTPDLSKLQEIDFINYSIQYVFVSDLIRTRDTYDMFKTYYKNKGNHKFQFPDAIVLPCSHEITTSGTNGNCDATTTVFNTSAFNNYPTCTVDKINKKNKACEANWNEYLKFYSNQMRNSVWKNNRRKCRDTNMIQEAINIMTPDIGSNIYVGGTRKRKTNRKKSRRIKL